jgi:hypothetical protein
LCNLTRTKGATSQSPERIVHRRIALSAVAASLVLASPSIHAHEWYPIECCSGRDCAAAELVVRRDDGSYLVTADGVSVVIPEGFHWRSSPDGQVHVCIRQVGGVGPTVVCAFRGPGA